MAKPIKSSCLSPIRYFLQNKTRENNTITCHVELHLRTTYIAILELFYSISLRKHLSTVFFSISNALGMFNLALIVQNFILPEKNFRGLWMCAMTYTMWILKTARKVCVYIVLMSSPVVHILWKGSINKSYCFCNLHFIRLHHHVERCGCLWICANYLYVTKRMGNNVPNHQEVD